MCAFNVHNRRRGLQSPPKANARVKMALGTDN
jgi:hypothetical protein